MLLISARVVPHSARASRSFSNPSAIATAITLSPASKLTLTSRLCVNDSEEPLPFSTVIVRSLIETLTPLGTATGCLPILDIAVFLRASPGSFTRGNTRVIVY